MSFATREGTEPLASHLDAHHRGLGPRARRLMLDRARRANGWPTAFEARRAGFL